MCFSPYLGIRCGGGRSGSPQGFVRNRVMQFFTLSSSKMEVFETDGAIHRTGGCTIFFPDFDPSNPPYLGTPFFLEGGSNLLHYCGPYVLVVGGGR